MPWRVSSSARPVSPRPARRRASRADHTPEERAAAPRALPGRASSPMVCSSRRSALVSPHRRAAGPRRISVSVKKNFYSDNVSGAAPEILEALVAANAGDTAPYGGDAVTERLQARFSELFESDVEVYPVGTGTAANGLCASIVA